MTKVLERVKSMMRQQVKWLLRKASKGEFCWEEEKTPTATEKPTTGAPKGSRKRIKKGLSLRELRDLEKEGN